LWRVSTLEQLCEAMLVRNAVWLDGGNLRRLREAAGARIAAKAAERADARAAGAPADDSDGDALEDALEQRASGGGAAGAVVR